MESGSESDDGWLVGWLVLFRVVQQAGTSASLCSAFTARVVGYEGEFALPGGRGRGLSRGGSGKVGEAVDVAVMLVLQVY